MNAMYLLLRRFTLTSVFLSAALNSSAQFLDDFDHDTIEGWFFFTGDGEATMNMEPHDGFARIRVDARNDRHNVWWSIIKRDIAPALDLALLQDPAYELRVEARVRLSHAPRRINFMINTQRTTDFHEHLAEYDIADTTQWHTVSYTTRNLEVMPGDSLFVQLGVTDWGLGEYFVDLDSYRADIVKVATTPPDVGEPLVYHPPLPSLSSFSHQLAASQSAVVRQDFPEVNFSNWRWHGPEASMDLHTLDGNQWLILRWDTHELSSHSVDSLGVLEFRLHSHAIGGHFIEPFGEDLGVEFGKLRIIEILGGAPDWVANEVTYASLTDGQPYEHIFNGQMIYDVDLPPDADGFLRLTLSRPALQRLLDGTTRGLLIRPLGALSATCFPAHSISPPTLYFSLAQTEPASQR